MSPSSSNVVFSLSGQHAKYSMGASYNQQGNLREADYTDDVVNLGAEGCEEEEEFRQEEDAYAESYNQEDNTEMSENQIDYAGEPAEGDDGYQYEVLDIDINEPLDGEFQVSFHICLLLLCKGSHAHTQSHPHVLPLTFSPPLYCVPEIMSRLRRSQDEKKSIQET